MVDDKGLSIAAIHRIIKKAGAYRVGESAANELARVLEEMGVKIGREAVDFAMYAGRRTVRAKDVRIAAKKLITQR